MPFRQLILSLCSLLFSLFLPATAQAQAEVLPAEHPVYRFLHAQRVAGHLPEYHHEMLPLDRGAVFRLLDSLTIRQDRLPGLARYWLDEFRTELFESPDQIEVVFSKKGLRIPHRPDSKKYFAYHRSEDWRVALEIAGWWPFRYASEVETHSGLGIAGFLRIQGNYRNWLGFYSESFNGIQFTGDTRVLKSDPELAPIYFIGEYNPPPGSFDRTSAALRAGNRTFFAEIAHQRLLYGNGWGDRLILGNGTDYFSALRLGLNTQPVQYHFIHGALGDRARSINPDPERPELSQIVGPQRYLAIHRLNVRPFSFFSFGFTEMVVYGLRGVELAYLNPVNALWTAEHALWDRDNAFFTLDGTLRPLPGLELSGAWLVDDFDFAKIGQNSISNKWAMQVGAGYSNGAFSGFVEYTRLEPFVYTHRFYSPEFETFYNSYQHNRAPLGHRLGPNSDQWAAGLKAWLPFRITAEATARYVQRGENFVDEQGAFVNVGGDLNQGFFPDFDYPKIFLAGERFAGPGLQLHLTYEPLRDIRLDFFADYQHWDHAPDALFWRAGLFIDW